MSDNEAVQLAHPRAIAATEPFGFDEQLVRDTICKGASPQEFALFIAIAKRLQLDPLARQIFAVKRWDSTLGKEVMSAQMSIDAFRLVAQRTGQYAGQTEPQWCGQTTAPDQDPVWVTAWLGQKPPAAARVGVWRKGFQAPVYAVARYASYVQTKKGGDPNRMWATMPDVMLSKCAEALALRKAFPMELSGAYTSDEMGQADDAPASEPAPGPDAAPQTEPTWKSDPMTDAQRDRLFSLATDPRLRGDIRVWLKRNIDTLSKGAANTAILKAKGHVEVRTGKPYVAFEDTGAADREPEEEPPPADNPPDDFPGLPADEFDSTPPPRGHARKAAESAKSRLDEVLERAKARGDGKPEAPAGQGQLAGTEPPPADRHGG